MDLNLDKFIGLTVGGFVSDGQISDLWPVDEDDAAAKDNFKTESRARVDKARADLDTALDRYVQAKVADSEDIERWRWRARGKAR
jgi:hypothetical protein